MAIEFIMEPNEKLYLIEMGLPDSASGPEYELFILAFSVPEAVAKANEYENATYGPRSGNEVLSIKIMATVIIQ